MRFVTSYSMTSGVRGGLQIVELLVAPGPNGLRLLLTQSPYLGPLSVGRYIVGGVHADQGLLPVFAPIQPRPDSLIVADQLATCEFLFQRGPQRNQDGGAWIPRWDDLRQLPQAIRIEMNPLEQEARLQPVTIVAEIRARYGDDALVDWRDMLRPGAEVVTVNGQTQLRLRPK